MTGKGDFAKKKKTLGQTGRGGARLVCPLQSTILYSLPSPDVHFPEVRFLLDIRYAIMFHKYTVERASLAVM